RSLFGKRSGLVVDVCRAHGTWFDATELERAALFLATGHAAITSPPAQAQAPPSADAVRRRAEIEVAATRESMEDERRLGRSVAGSSRIFDLIYELVMFGD